MDRRLQIVQSLYGEGENREEVYRLLREDAELWREYQALSEVKFELDHRRPDRPDAATLEAVLAAASGHAAAPRAARRDRPPAARRARRLAGFAGVLLVLVATGVGLWQVLTVAVPPAGTSQAAHTPVAGPEAPLAAERPSRTPPSAPAPAPDADSAQAPVLAATSAGAEGPDEGAREAALVWDESDAVRELHERIELLQAGVGQGWDERVVPLEAAPPPGRPDPGAPGLQQVGTRPPR